MTVVVVGKNSFVAKHLQKTDACKDWVFLSHDGALSNDDWLTQASAIINCSFSPELYKADYNENEDIDTKLACKVKDRPEIRYIMLSSRMVYGENGSFEERGAVAPNTPYGRNKFCIENKLMELLGESRVCIIRCSNVFGFEFGRSSFFGRMLSALNNDGKIVFDMSPETRKDFLPVNVLCDVLVRIVNEKVSGLYNVGSGISLPCGEVAEWVMEGYGTGQLEIRDDAIKGQFSMDVSKIGNRLKLPLVTRGCIKERCIELGQELRGA